MRSFSSFTAFFILLLCMIDVINAAPAPPRKPAARPPARAPARPAPVRAPTRPAPVRAPTRPAPRPVTPPARPATPPARPGTPPPARPGTPPGTKPPAKPPAKPVTPPAKPPATPPAQTCPFLPPKKGAKGATPPKAAPTRGKKPRELLDAVVSLFRRQNTEFVGWHGTNGGNACKYMEAGRKGRGLPILSQFNGNDAELGPGLYVTDDIVVAKSFAISSANGQKARKATGDALDAYVCKVEAVNQNTWRANVPKFWVPFTALARTGGAAALTLQKQLIRNEQLDPDTTVRFSALDDRGGLASSNNQFSIPTTQFSNFRITACLLVEQATNAAGLVPAAQSFPSFNYQSFRQVVGGPWAIRGNTL